MKINCSAALPAEGKEMSRIFVTLGDERRQRMLLLFAPGECLHPGRIAEVSTLARSTVSHHLKVRHESGVLASEKVGKEVGCRINRVALDAALGNVFDYRKENI